MRITLLLAGLLLAGPALAQSNAPAPASAPLTAQQERMRGCNADAATKKLAGNDRQVFMSSCLSGGGTTSAFKTEVEAKKACAAAPVVWANSDSQIFHLAGSQFYGKTAEGAFMCEPAAVKAGYRAAGTAKG